MIDWPTPSSLSLTVFLLLFFGFTSHVFCFGGGCSQNWGIKLYNLEHFRGDFDCFSTGKYIVGKHIPRTISRRISFRIRPGFEVRFFNKYGRLMKAFERDISYLPNGFSFFVVQKRRSSSGKASSKCFDDWAIQIYQSPYFRGQPKCFKMGEYYGGKDCPSYVGQNISIKIRPGYYLSLYDRSNRLIKKCYGNVKLYQQGFYRFEIKKDRYGYRKS